MATSITADDMLAALKKWGITPKFYKTDWRTHNRNAVQGWGPLYGFVVHNFASDISDTSSLAYLYNGDSARRLPGPLSQFAITDDGQVWIIGWGTANHAATVDIDLHNLVKLDKAPLDRDYVPNSNGDSPAREVFGSNPHYIGVEMTYGAKGATAAQRAACVRLATAMVDMLGGIGAGYTGGSVIGHREATTSRSDPQGMSMWQFRRDVNALLQKGSTVPTVPKTTTTVTASPNPSIRLDDAVVTATTSPAVPGRHTFEFSTDSGKTWRTFKTVDTTNGSSRFDWRFGGVHPIRARFTPKDPTKHQASVSAAFDVVTVPVSSLVADLAALKARVTKLETL